MRLDQLMKRAFPRLPYSLVQKALRTGKIHLNERPQKKASYRVTSGEKITLFLPYESLNESLNDKKKTPPDSTLCALAKEVPRWILYEDKDLLVLNKPVGLATQAGTQTPISLDRIVTYYADNAYTPRLTHRLDKDTSGVLVMAKTRHAAQHMTKLFQDATPKKIYWACVVGTPPHSQGKIDRALGKMTGVQKEKMSSAAKDVRPALTLYKVLETTSQDPPLSWLELTPKTGRTHQLRAHCAEEGFPIVGDGKYGGRRAHPFQKRLPLCLHARSLHFPDALGKTHTLTAPLPKGLQDFLATYFQGSVSGI